MDRIGLGIIIRAGWLAGHFWMPGIDLVNYLGIIQITYDAQHLLTQACACGIVMLAPKVWTAPSYSPAGSYVYVVAS